MSVKVATNRFIVSSLKGWFGFYQQLFRSVSDFKELGQRLIGAAETAIAFRQIDQVLEAGLMLSNIPLKEYRLIGQYYLGWSAYRRGEDAQSIFENVIENSKTYKAKGLISLAACEVARQNYDSAFNHCQEVTRRTDNPSLLLTAARSIAFLKSMKGDHRQALNDLEKLAPLARYTTPTAYYNYLNSLAVELAEAGRLEEASNMSNIVLASPYAFAYPEWRETSEEIHFRGYRTSRSILSLNHSALNLNNVLRLPLPEQNFDAGSEHLSRSPFQQQASITSLQEWKSKMVKEPNGDDEVDFSKMTDKEKLFKIIELSSNEHITDDQLDRILDAVIRITSKRT